MTSVLAISSTQLTAVIDVPNTSCAGGKSASKETREKMKISQSGEKNPNSYWWKITFSNQKSVVLCGLSTWASKNGYNVGNIHSIYKGIRKKHKDIIMVEKIK